jgi:hypothetical protein
MAADVIDISGADTYQHDCGLGHLLQPKTAETPGRTGHCSIVGVACEILGWVGMGHVTSSFNILCAWTG